MEPLNKTTVDWLRFRTQSDPFQTLEAIRPAFGTVAGLVQLGDYQRGKDGWEQRRPIMLAGDVVLGAVDYGGDSQRGWLRWDMPGGGCEWVQDWAVVAGLVGVLDRAELRRVDLALTTADPGLVSHEKVLAAHAADLFSSGGRSPKARIVTGSEPSDGRTVYVGSRTAHKFIRCYEKGREMMVKAGVPEGVRKQVERVEFDGLGMVNVADLYRVEVEFKDVDKVLPWPMLTDRDAYFAGANPFCASLLPGAPIRKAQGLPDFGGKLALRVQVEHARRAYGALIRTLYEVHGGDADKVLGMLMADKPSEKLVRAGVLTMAHE